MKLNRLWFTDDANEWWCVDYIETPQGLQVMSDPYMANNQKKDELNDQA